MIYQIGVAILFITSAVAEDVASLRGSVTAASKHIYSQATALDSQTAQEIAMRSYLDKATKHGIKSNSHNHMESQSFGNTAKHPNLSFEDFFVSRKWTGAGCHGEVESLMAMRLGCQSDFSNEGGGIYFRCGPQTEEGDLQLLGKKSSPRSLTMYMDFYANNDCSGDILYTSQSIEPAGCMEDYGYQCVAHDRTPEFATKEGLTTYKFKSGADCQVFSSNELNHFAWPAEGTTNFDDDFVAQEDDEMQFGNYEDIPSRRTSFVSNKEVAPHEDYREYMISQQRNRACAFDPKYQVWVKSNCHSKANRMVYMMFEDAECTRVMKRSVHKLDEAVPFYAQCVQSSTDNRAALTVCHNSQSGDGDDWEGEEVAWPETMLA